jgi:hypothetical protein
VEDIRDCETERKRLMGEITKDALNNFYSIINITGAITTRKMQQAQRVASMTDVTNSHKILVRKFERFNNFRDPDGETILSRV